MPRGTAIWKSASHVVFVEGTIRPIRLRELTCTSWDAGESESALKYKPGYIALHAAASLASAARNRRSTRVISRG